MPAAEQLAFAAALIAGLVGAAAPAAAAERIGPEAWQRVDLPDHEPNRFDIARDGTITVVSADSVSLLVHEVMGTSEAATRLTWEWRVEEPGPLSDLRVKGADDRPVAVHVWYPDPDPGLLGRIGLGLRSMAGVPTIGRAITYVWGGKEPAGTRFDSPFLDNGIVIVLRAHSTPTGEWLSETVDIAADFEAAFGEPPPPLGFVAISADADDLDGETHAQVRRVTLVHP